MPRAPRHTRTEVVEALLRVGGDVTNAAKSLGLSRAALTGRAARDVELRKAIRNARRIPGAKPCAHCGGSGVVP